jgi:hypothetical protein
MSFIHSNSMTLGQEHLRRDAHINLDTVVQAPFSFQFQRQIRNLMSIVEDAMGVRLGSCAADLNYLRLARIGN